MLVNAGSNDKKLINVTSLTVTYITQQSKIIQLTVAFLGQIFTRTNLLLVSSV